MSYTFFICSTINSTYGKLDLNTRVADTLACIDSIYRHVPDAEISMVDNSNDLPFEARHEIEKRLNLNALFTHMPHNLFSTVANIKKLKSASEANLMYFGLGELLSLTHTTKRVFKISGRYKLSDTFNPHAYDAPMYDSKYITAIHQYVSSYDDKWEVLRRVPRFETGLVSWTHDLTEEFRNLMPSVLWHCLSQPDTCIEESLLQHIPHNKIIAVEKVHVEGNKAEGDGYVRY